MPKRTNTTNDSTATDVSTNPATVAVAVPPLDKKSRQLLAALAELGEATAGGLAEQVGIAYSTATPRLRKLNSYGLAEPTKAGNGQTVWHLTETGRDHAAAGNTGPADEDDVADGAAMPESATVDAGSDPVPSAEPPAESVTALPADIFDELTDGMNVDAEPVSPNLAEALTEALDGPAGEPREVPAAGEGVPDQAEEAEPDADASGAVSAGSAEEGTDLPIVPDSVTDGSGDEDEVADATSADGSAAAETADGGAAEPVPVDGTSSTETGEADARDADSTGTDQTDQTDTDTDTDTANESAPAADADGTRPIRRAPGDLDRAILPILRSQPDNVFKVGELCKLINNAEEGTGVPKASPGAVVLAAQRLVKRQQAILAVEKPASFQLLPGATAEPATGTEPAETVTAASP